HTRFSRDWSSDVCSSDLRDLAATLRGYELAVEDAAERVQPALEREIVAQCVASGLFAPNLPKHMGGAGLDLRQQVVIEEELGGEIGRASCRERVWMPVGG